MLDRNCCNPDPCCGKPKCADPCGCPKRVLSVEATDAPGVVKFNLDGHTTLLDFSDVVKDTETDTFLRVDQVARLLKYIAEGHVNNIRAQELGSILHLADIGDINTEEVTQNSLLVYKKESDCGQGCDQVSNNWIAWNATEHLEDSAEKLMGFDETDSPVAIEPPLHTGQYYSLMWRAGDKIGYRQPTQVSAPSADESGYSHLLFENPTTHELETLPVKVTVAQDGTVTLKTQGGV